MRYIYIQLQLLEDQMSSIVELIKIRYSPPLEALQMNALIKSVLSIVAVFFSLWGDFITVLSDMFNTPVELVLLLLIAIAADWYTGIQCAKRNKTYIRSLGLRQTWVKIIEYALGLLILTGIGNVFGAADIEGWVGDSLRFLKNIHWLGYFYATFTELKSIGENMEGKKGRFAEVIRKINKRFFGDKDDDKIR